MDEKRILIVDDDVALLKVMKDILEKAGFKVDVTSVGEQVPSFLEKHDYVLVILDVKMYSSSGYQVVDVIKKNSEGFPKVVYCSVMLKNEIKDMAKVDGYIHKPFEVDELVKKVTKIIST